MRFTFFEDFFLAQYILYIFLPHTRTTFTFPCLIIVIIVFVCVYVKERKKSEGEKKGKNVRYRPLSFVLCRLIQSNMMSVMMMMSQYSRKHVCKKREKMGKVEERYHQKNVHIILRL